MSNIYTMILFTSILVSATWCSTKSKIDKGHLIGDWAPSPEENVDFTISKDNIKYFEDDYLYTYKIKQNTFSLIDSGHLIANYEIILLTKDSLVWKTEEENVFRLIKRE